MLHLLSVYFSVICPEGAGGYNFYSSGLVGLGFVVCRVEGLGV